MCFCIVAAVPLSIFAVGVIVVVGRTGMILFLFVFASAFLEPFLGILRTLARVTDLSDRSHPRDISTQF
jgi:hypothetical protein